MEKKKGLSYAAYEEMAVYYAQYVDKKPFNAYYERPALLSLLPDVQEKQVLDVACGAGWYTQWLLQQGASVTAVDFSPSMIEMTRRRVGQQAVIIQGDLNGPLDYLQDESIAVILSSLTLHYIRDWDHVFREFYRVLAPLGYLVFSVHHPFMDFTRFKRENYFSTEIIEDVWSTHQGMVEVQFYRRPLKEIVNPLLQGGFLLEALEEPMPTEEFHREMPEVYDRLTKNPTFLFIRARKR